VVAHREDDPSPTLAHFLEAVDDVGALELAPLPEGGELI
jgi:hypothetical protein